MRTWSAMTENSVNITKIAIAGTGKVGQCLARTIYSAGLPLGPVISRHPANVIWHRELSEPEVITADLLHPEPGMLLFIAIPDDAITSFAEQISDLHNWSNTVAVHCSGAVPASKLQSLQKKGALTACFHPLQTFTEGSGPDAFRNIFVSLQGDEAAVKLLTPLANAMGAKTLVVDETGKIKLHLAAVFASNYIAGLMEAAQSVTEGEVAVEKVLGPLLIQAARNLADQGRENALTGPIVRGDTETIGRHLKLLDGNPDLRKLYALLGLYTLKAARKKNNQPEYSIIEQMFNAIHNVAQR